MPMKKGIGIIKYLSKFLPIKTLDQMYKALVRSHLDCCYTIYHIPASNSQIKLGATLNSLMKKVERTQYRAALAITGTCQGTNRSKLYEELGWETLSDRRWCRRIPRIHKIEKYKTPSYLSVSLSLPHRRPMYRLKNSNALCKTARYKNVFFPDATSSWNNMISLICPKIKSTFGIHDALRFRYHFQLRVTLCPLRSHKRCHNFSDTPSETCECNLGIEDIRHYLFECPFYAIQRVSLAVNVI